MSKYQSLTIGHPQSEKGDYFKISINFKMDSGNNIVYITEENDVDKTLIVLNFFEGLKESSKWCQVDGYLEHKSDPIKDVFEQIQEEGLLGYDTEFKVDGYDIVYLDTNNNLCDVRLNQ